MLPSNLEFSEIHWARNLFIRTERLSSDFHLRWYHPGYVKNKTGLRKISRSVERWIQDQSIREVQTHTGCPCRVCEEYNFTLSTPVYWRNRTFFLFSLTSKKVSGMWRWKFWFSSSPSADSKFEATRYLDETRYFIERSKTMDIRSKSRTLPQQFPRFRWFPNLWARKASD